jgi:hypothetical protein
MAWDQWSYCCVILITFTFTIFRCVDEEHLEPRDRPLVCLASRSKLHENNIGCCTSGDACNANMTLDLTPRALDADDTVSLGGERAGPCL